MPRQRAFRTPALLDFLADDARALVPVRAEEVVVVVAGCTPAVSPGPEASAAWLVAGPELTFRPVARVVVCAEGWAAASADWAAARSDGLLPGAFLSATFLSDPGTFLSDPGTFLSDPGTFFSDPGRAAFSTGGRAAFSAGGRAAFLAPG